VSGAGAVPLFIAAVPSFDGGTRAEIGLFESASNSQRHRKGLKCLCSSTGARSLVGCVAVVCAEEAARAQ